MNSSLTINTLPRWFYAGLGTAAVMVMALYLGLERHPVDPLQNSSEPVAEVPQATVTEQLVAKPQARQEEKALKADSIADTGARLQDERVEADRMMKKQMPESEAMHQAEVQRMIAVAPSMPAAPMPQAGLQAKERALPSRPDEGRDRFSTAAENPVKRVQDEPVSTFSIDVDTSSYSFIRRQLNQGVLPQKAAVRVEEMINYFPYAYPYPQDSSQPFSTQVTVLDSPWKRGNKLVHIGIQGYQLQGEKPATNLVFLLDVSGSMNQPDKLPLVKQSMDLLLSQLQPQDKVSIVVYAGAAGTVLEPTPVQEKDKIFAALNQLRAGGSTAGAAGIQLAYQLAEQNFIEGGVNRIILATDGDFNVGISNREALKGYVERKRQSGVFLSVLGFGQGNYNDALMQDLAQNGNGVAAYIDSLSEAQKVLVEEATSNLFPIAKDVKIQLEFNPATVAEYRLLGYESRMLATEDFKNDAVDAGDIGAGHRVTAIYEITPVDAGSGVYPTSRYSDTAPETNFSSEYGYLKMRYKLPQQDHSLELGQAVPIQSRVSAEAAQEASFATAVAGFGQLLKGGKYTGSWSYDDALQLALANRGHDPYGYRSELVQLIRKAKLADAM